MRLSNRYLHIRSMVSGMEMDLRLLVHSVETHKRTTQREERSVLLSTQWWVLSLISSLVIVA